MLSLQFSFVYFVQNKRKRLWLVFYSLMPVSLILTFNISSLKNSEGLLLYLHYSSGVLFVKTFLFLYQIDIKINNLFSLLTLPHHWSHPFFQMTSFFLHTVFESSVVAFFLFVLDIMLNSTEKYGFSANFNLRSFL